jgi:Flp pilus assembly protein TadG
MRNRVVNRFIPRPVSDDKNDVLRHRLLNFFNLLTLQLSNSKGAAMVEFSIIMPALIMLLVISADLTRAVNQYRTTGRVAYEATRLAGRTSNLAFGGSNFNCDQNYTTKYPIETFGRQICDIVTSSALTCLGAACPVVTTSLYTVSLPGGNVATSRKVVSAKVTVPFVPDLPFFQFMLSQVQAQRIGPYLFP